MQIMIEFLTRKSVKLISIEQRLQYTEIKKCKLKYI